MKAGRGTAEDREPNKHCGEIIAQTVLWINCVWINQHNDPAEHDDPAERDEMMESSAFTRLHKLLGVWRTIAGDSNGVNRKSPCAQLYRISTHIIMLLKGWD